ncbi:MAG TPA: protein kinase [Streptosporangiaceae bacterium]|nr:protein kinase [Streptosporangiaceae bacterium]
MLTSQVVVGGRYELDARIGAGGFSEVWRASDRTLGRRVAIKLLYAGYAQHGETLARFRAEARHAGQLSQENIAHVYDYGEPAGDLPPYLVMELVEGPSLAEVLAIGPLNPVRTARILAQAAAGLDAAHRAGLIHRDIKPGNLLLGPGGIVKITDFGVAHAADSARLTGTGMVAGTPGYLAPERATGAPATTATDLYSLGIVAYECLAGHPPFTGTALQVTQAHCSQPLPDLPASVPAELAALVSDLTARHPRDRPASAAVVVLRAGQVADRAAGGSTLLEGWAPAGGPPGGLLAPLADPDVPPRDLRALPPGPGALPPGPGAPPASLSAPPGGLSAPPPGQGASPPGPGAPPGSLSSPPAGLLRGKSLDASSPGPAWPPTAPDRLHNLAGPARQAGPDGQTRLDEPSRPDGFRGPDGPATARLTPAAGPAWQRQPAGRHRPARTRRRLALGAAAAALIAVAIAVTVSQIGGTPARHGTTAPSPSTQPAATRAPAVTVSASALIGQPVATVARELRERGLAVRVRWQSSAAEPPGRVLAVSPTGRLRAGSLIVVTGALRPSDPAGTSGNGKGKARGKGNGHGNGGG